MSATGRNSVLTKKLDAACSHSSGESAIADDVARCSLRLREGASSVSR